MNTTKINIMQKSIIDTDARFLYKVIQDAVNVVKNNPGCVMTMCLNGIPYSIDKNSKFSDVLRFHRQLVYKQKHR